MLLARRSDAFAVVRKAPVQGTTYEFVGLYTLPGGMVRVRKPGAPEAGAAESLLRTSLFERAHREAGLVPELLLGAAPADMGPIVTSYTAKMQQCFTLIVPYTCEAGPGARLEISDRSVDESAWMTLPPTWEKMAPANRVAVAHMIWSELNVDQRAVARQQVNASVRQCSDWAMSIGVVPVPPPWASNKELTTWRDSWPTVESE